MTGLSSIPRLGLLYFEGHIISLGHAQGQGHSTLHFAPLFYTLEFNFLLSMHF